MHENPIFFLTGGSVLRRTSFKLCLPGSLPKDQKSSPGVRGSPVLSSARDCRSLCLDSSQRTRRLPIEIGYPPCRRQRLTNMESKYPSADLAAIMWTVTPREGLSSQ